MYIYLDESGDLGFDFTKAKTSRKFVITLLICYDMDANRAFGKAVQRTLRRLSRPKGKSRNIEELKGSQTSLKTKEYFLRQIKSDQWHLCSLILNKERVNPDLRTKGAKPRLYNFIAGALIGKLSLDQVTANVRLIVDRSKNREEIRDFNQYVRNQIEARLPLNTGFQIEHLTSQESAGLQAVDLFCWGVFRKYELRDYGWYKQYGHKFRYESEYLRE